MHAKAALGNKFSVAFRSFGIVVGARMLSKKAGRGFLGRNPGPLSQCATRWDQKRAFPDEKNLTDGEAVRLNSMCDSSWRAAPEG